MSLSETESRFLGKSEVSKMTNCTSSSYDMFNDISALAVLSIDPVIRAFASRCLCRTVIHSVKFGAAILTRVCVDLQASDLLHLRPAAGVPDPRVM